MFDKKLKQAMQDLHLNQVQVCGLTGKSRRATLKRSCAVPSSVTIWQPVEQLQRQPSAPARGQAQK